MLLRYHLMKRQFQPKEAHLSNFGCTTPAGKLEQCAHSKVHVATEGFNLAF